MTATKAATTAVALLLCTTALPTLLEAAQRKSVPKAGTPAIVRPSVPNGMLPEGTGTLTYDNNTPFSRNGTDGGTVGNLFNTATDPHGVATATFRLAGNYDSSATTGSVIMSIWDVEPASFMLLARQNITNAPAVPYGGSANVTMFTVTAPLTMAVVAHNGAFVGGIRNTDYNGCAGNVALNTTCDGVALTMGGVDPGMGFHGFRVPFNSAAFLPTIVTVPGTGEPLATINAIFRVTGDNLPVELMSFGVE